MERKRNNYLISLMLMVFPVFIFNAGAQDVRCYFQEAFAKGDFSGWYNEIVRLEKSHPTNFGMTVEALTARYGYIGHLIGSKQNTQARRVLSETEKILDTWLAKNPKSARLHAIKAGLVGFRIGLSPLRAPFLGQQNVDAWEAAISLDPNEPMGWVEKGNSLFHRPAMFGGDKHEAEMAFRKALELASPDECDWFYLFLQVRIYESLKANGKNAEANALKRNLQQKPGHFRWIEDL